MLDLRKPAGYFFALLGVLLVLVGAARNIHMLGWLLVEGDMGYGAPLLDFNLNLYFGVFCILLGGTFLWLSRKA